MQRNVVLLFVVCLTLNAMAEEATPNFSIFQHTVPNQAASPKNAPVGMAWIPGGEFSMGSKDPTPNDCSMPGGMSDAQPIHRVYVNGFWMDRTDVINEQFAKFVRATGYLTIAEKKPLPRDFPGVPLENLVAGSPVFTPASYAVSLDNIGNWWRYQKG